MSADPVQREPTMDEILSSIRRIVSDDEVVVNMPSRAERADSDSIGVEVEYAHGSGAPGVGERAEKRAEAGRSQAGRDQARRAASTAPQGEELVDIPRTLQAAVEEGLEANLDVKAARAEEAAALHRLRVAKGELMPMMDAAGKVQQAQTRADRARFDRIAAERSVTQSITTAWHDMVGARMEIKDTQANVSHTKANLETAQQQLSVGERFTPEVLALEKILLEARLSLVDAKRRGWHSAHRLLAAIGRLDGGALAD